MDTKQANMLKMKKNENLKKTAKLFLNKTINGKQIDKTDKLT